MVKISFLIIELTAMTTEHSREDESHDCFPPFAIRVSICTREWFDEQGAIALNSPPPS